jgi:hypothetical protein
MHERGTNATLTVTSPCGKTLPSQSHSKTKESIMKLVANNPQVTTTLAALPQGFLVNKVTTSGREVMKPVSRADFRKANGYGNAEAKRIYGSHLQKFTAAISADFAAQVAMGKVAKEVSVGRSGVRTYKVGEMKAAPAVRSLPASQAELEVALAASLGMEVEALRAMTVLAQK